MRSAVDKRSVIGPYDSASRKTIHARRGGFCVESPKCFFDNSLTVGGGRLCHYCKRRPGNGELVRDSGRNNRDQHWPQCHQRKSGTLVGDFRHRLSSWHCEWNDRRRQCQCNAGPDGFDGRLQRCRLPTMRRRLNRPESGRTDSDGWSLLLCVFGAVEWKSYSQRSGRCKCRLHLPDRQYADHFKRLEHHDYQWRYRQ